MSIILSVADSLIMSGIDQFAAEKWRDKKRDKQLQEDYNTWLEREKGQQYYDALDRALSNSNIIQEFITYTCCPDRRFSIHDRIEDLFRYGSFTDEEKIYISHAVETLFSILKNDLLLGDDEDTNRLASRMESNKIDIIEKLDNLDRRISIVNTDTVYISALHGEAVPVESIIFRRKIFPNTEEYSTQGKKEYSLPIDVIQEKRIIIVIGEAGYGKTYLLYQICHDAKERGLHALYYSLKRTNYPDILNLLETKQLGIDRKTVLILDGLDEIKPDIRNSIITTIQSIGMYYSNLHVVLSMRSNFYTSTQGKEVYNKSLKTAFFIKTGETIMDTPLYDDVKKAEALGHQKYFNALFSREQYDILINKLGELFGSDCIVGEVKACKFHDQFREEPVLRDTYYGLRYLLGSEKEKTSFSTVMSKIQNWNVFLVFAVDNILSNYLMDITISEEQTKVLEQIVVDILKPEVFSITVKDATHYSFSTILPPSLRIIRMTNLNCPEDLVIRMLTVPFDIWDKEEHHSIPNYIATHLEHETLVKCIIQNIKNKIWNSLVAPNYINFCIDNNIREVKHEVIDFLFDTERNRFGINDGVEYLCKLFGYEEIEQNVLPRCNEDELLTSIAYHTPFNIQSYLLEEKMMNAYRISQNQKWLPLLIHRSNVEALEEYYQLACSSNQIPDMTEGSQVPYIADAFRSITKIKALPILVKLMKLTFYPGFKDKEFFGLYSGCWDAIMNIAKEKYEEVNSLLGLMIIHLLMMLFPIC